MGSGTKGASSADWNTVVEALDEFSTAARQTIDALIMLKSLENAKDGFAQHLDEAIALLRDTRTAFAAASAVAGLIANDLENKAG